MCIIINLIMELDFQDIPLKNHCLNELYTSQVIWRKKFLILKICHFDQISIEKEKYIEIKKL